jgi:hypothetical protein
MASRETVRPLAGCNVDMACSFLANARWKGFEHVQGLTGLMVWIVFEGQED